MKGRLSRNGETIQSPAGVIVAILLMALGVLIFLVLSPILVPLHFILRCTGRKGLMGWNGGDAWIDFSTKMFKKV